MMSEKNEAANMTPAEKPSRASLSRCESLRTKKTHKAPTAVAAPAAMLAAVPMPMSCQSILMPQAGRDGFVPHRI
jgi:hypothetical protein